ncbi:MAG TPA: carboxypeptidase-like regulatory domain-containing protein [Terracidiphilus sp.]|nr:carboxypeptidase-like regulatory domain-containing protein [Terracidiphilus sp.]
MRTATCVLGGVLACGSPHAIAQNSQSQSRGVVSGEATSGSYRIAGVLVNAKTDEPVRRATVEALKEADSRAVASCITDSEGHFALTGLTAAKYQLTASKRGFRTAFYDEHDQFSTAIVTGPDQETTQLRFKLMPRAVLHGAVTGDDGEPVASARVMLFQRPKHPSDGARTMQVDATVTDDTGAYEFGDLAAGEYLLAVMAEPWYAVHEGSPAKRNPALDVAYPVTYFDSTTEEGSATPLVLAGGSREEANISMHAVPALRIRVDSPGRPDHGMVGPNLQQTVFGLPAGLDGSISEDGLHGTMEISGIAPGHYELTQGDPQRIVDLDLLSSLQVDPNAGSAALTVTGRLRMASGSPVPGDPTITLARMDGAAGQPVYATQAHRGQFTFDAVPPGQWAVMATGTGTLIPVVSVSAGGMQRAGNVATLRERGSDLVITLSDAETRIEGFARKNGKGLAGAMIVLLPRSPALWQALTRRDQSDSDGSFALQNVAPGQYTLVAIEDGWEIDWTSPDAMARYLPGGTSVTVSEKSGALIRLASPVTVETP